MTVEIAASLSEADVIWQYMSIDKFICIFSEKSLYLASLAAFKKSDPFEGYIPMPALRALLGYSKYTPHPQWITDDTNIENEYYDLISGIFVNCWHGNNSESEAMWKLYSKEHEGIAIKTTVGRLKNSLEEFDDGFARIGKVRYIDFESPDINPNNCMSDGVLMPLIKRESYGHENEIRLYMKSWENGVRIIPENTKSCLIKIDPIKLFDEIYISPYSGAIFTKAVFAVCGKFGIPIDKIVRSKLLGDPSYLFGLTDLNPS